MNARHALRLSSGLLIAAGLLLTPEAASDPLRGVVELAAGSRHSCARIDDGSLRCWGGNAFGQLGDDSRSDRYLLIEVGGLSAAAVRVTAGAEHSCAIVAGGELHCWGFNFYGQLGVNDSELRLLPTPVQGLPGPVAEVVAGDDHSCARLQNGRVFCWGANADGQLGSGAFADSLLPREVDGLPANAMTIAAGARHSCAVLVGGEVYCWGFNFAGQLGNGEQGEDANRSAPVAVSSLDGVSALALGTRHSCALRQGAVLCWGANGSGQLGHDRDTLAQPLAAPVDGLDSGFLALGLGEEHSCALHEDGRVLCWGANGDGQLGDGSPQPRAEPMAVSGIDDATQLASGRSHVCVRSAAGTAQCWGFNFHGQLGDGSTSQRFAPSSRVAAAPRTPMQVVAGERHSCALGGNGQVRCWGWNLFGALGDGSIIQRLRGVAVAGLERPARQLAANGFSSCAVLDTGAARCWGRNDFGQLGNGAIGDELQAVPVLGLESGVRHLAVGLQHGCAAGDDGRVRCWGANFAGQLGDGSNELRTAPVLVDGVDNVDAIYASTQTHSCALREDGAVLCWGGNEVGQLGDGSQGDSNTPVAVQGLAGPVASLALGNQHSCALTRAGAVQCWGSNALLQLGSENFGEGQLQPVTVPGLDAGVVEIAAGEEHSCARRVAGEVRCWGRNDIGQAGDGTTLATLAPTAVTSLGDQARSLGMGGDHACAILVDGAIRCWGSNFSGQFGDGSFGGKPIAVDVRIDAGERSVGLAVEAVADSTEAPSSDGSGRYLAFRSRDPSLPDAPGGFAVYRLDTLSQQIELASRDDQNVPVDGDAGEPTLSADGRWLAFVAADAGVRALRGEGKAAAEQRRKAGTLGLFLRNMLTGSTQRLATAPVGGSSPQFAAAGGAIVYSAPVSDPQQGKPAQQEVFLQPLATEADEVVLPEAARCVSCKAVDAAGNELEQVADGPSGAPTVSADGAWVAFQSMAKNLPVEVDPPCPQAATQVLLRNMLTGQVQRVSTPSNGNCGNAGALAQKPQIDWPGRKLVFSSDQPLIAGDSDARQDVFLFDLSNGSKQRLSGSGVADGNGDSLQPRISGDGRVVSYVSDASNLDLSRADNNRRRDLHVLLLGGSTGTVRRLEQNPQGDASDGDSQRPALNYNGTRVAFDSDAGNLDARASGGVSQVYRRSNPLLAGKVFEHGFE